MTFPEIPIDPKFFDTKPNPDMSKTEIEIIIRDAVENLPPKQRDVVTAWFWGEDKSYAEDDWAVHRSTVNRWLREALATLRETLPEEVRGLL